MTTFKVTLQQYVEELAELEIEAETLEEAKAQAMEAYYQGEVEWQDGSDSYEASLLKVELDGKLVWHQYDLPR